MWTSNTALNCVGRLRQGERKAETMQHKYSLRVPYMLYKVLPLYPPRVWNLSVSSAKACE
jgi:hypothetical protein